MNPQTQTITDQAQDLRMPSMYAVIIHNDEVTSMDFVVDVLIQIFHKPAQEAAALMMEVHEKGHGVAGIYVYDIAATKKAQTDLRAAEKGFPLNTIIRPMS